MEDAHTTLTEIDGTANTSIFAVYDGHGGSYAAKYAGLNMHPSILKSPDFAAKNYEIALKKGFLQTDENLRNDPQHQKEPCGCTAVLTMITENNTIYCANAGDSRAVLADNGIAEPLSYDHKPSNPTEYARINNAGGFVEFGRVNGNLALSRAIGDFEFKQSAHLSPEDQVVTCNPDITVHAAKDSHEFFIVACDGIWDVLTSQQAIDFISIRIAQGLPLGLICEEMTDHCLAKDATAGVGCDNMTVVICAILNGKTESEWREMVTKRFAASGLGAIVDSPAETMPMEGVN